MSTNACKCPSSRKVIERLLAWRTLWVEIPSISVLTSAKSMSQSMPSAGLVGGSSQIPLPRNCCVYQHISTIFHIRLQCRCSSCSRAFSRCSRFCRAFFSSFKVCSSASTCRASAPKSGENRRPTTSTSTMLPNIMAMLVWQHDTASPGKVQAFSLEAALAAFAAAIARFTSWPTPHDLVLLVHSICGFFSCLSPVRRLEILYGSYVYVYI